MEFIKTNARQIDISGNALLLLTRPDCIYLVTSDTVDVFVVPLLEGHPHGIRHFLFRAEKGSLLVGLDPSGYGSGLGLIVIGKPGSTVLEAPVSCLAKASQGDDPVLSRQARDLVQGWTAHLSLALDQGISPRDSSLLEEGRQGLQAGEHVRIGQGHPWVKLDQGRTLFCSNPEWQVTPQDGYLPISDHTWLTAAEETQIHCLSGEQYQRIDPDYQALAVFHRLFFDFIVQQQGVRDQQERLRLDGMHLKDEEHFSSTLVRLAESLTPGLGRGLNVSAAGDDLLVACQRVGRETGLEVHEPAAEAKINTDPLQAIAKGSNFRMRRVALKGSWWASDGGTMLGFLNDSQSGEKRPVVLLQTAPGNYVLEDPRTGTTRPIDKHVNDELELFGYLFYAPLPNRPLKAMDLFKFGFFKLGRDRGMIMLMAISAALLGLLPPIASGIIFDTVIPEAERYSLMYLGIILITSAIATGLFEVTKIFSTMRLVSKMDFRLQSGIMDRLLSLPTLFFRDYSAGDLAERTLGINAIREILSGATLGAMMSGIFSCFSLSLLFYYSWQLALVAMGITTVSVLVVICVGYAQIRYQRSIAHFQGKLTGMVLQLISGVSKLRVSGTEDRAFSAWAETFGAMRKSSFQSAKVSNYLYAFTVALPAISLFILFGWISYSPLINTLSVGDIIAFNTAFTQFQGALLQLSMTLISSLQVIPLYERAKPILEAVPEVTSGKAGPGMLTGHIEVNNLNFHYDPNGPLILNDVSLEIQPGEFAAVVGGSGSGKSTLLRLLLSFETPESGSIYYDSQDLANLDVVAVRRQLGVVLQNGSVMPGDIFSNIVGTTNLKLEDAWEAARMAGLDQDIQAMPMGMQTMVSPGGGTLSGGQRQRMLIARAIVHKPRILYFDEATSALDNATQKIVSQSLERLNATRVVIAHRLSTIKHADKIFVMNKGTIEQQGTYHELMNQPGLFAELAKRQLV